MHSGLAAYVYVKIMFLNRVIPGTISEQAQWWAQHYHEGVGVTSQFVDAANDIVYNPSKKQSFEWRSLQFARMAGTSVTGGSRGGFAHPFPSI